MSAVTSSPSLVILDVDAEKRYRLESKATLSFVRLVADDSLSQEKRPFATLFRFNATLKVLLLRHLSHDQDLDTTAIRDFVTAFRQGKLKVRFLSLRVNQSQ